MEISTIGIDLSKTTFHLLGLSPRGDIVLRKKLSRKQLLTFTATRTPLLISIEACAGAHFLARALRDHGHDARLMPAQYIKPYVKTNKNDYLDAEAIAEAVQRPTMRFVPIKSDEQLDLQALHRVRDRWVARRTAAMSQICGFLLELGIAIRIGPSHLVSHLQIIFSDGDSLFSGRLLHLIRELKLEWDELQWKIEKASAELARIAKQDDGCHRLMEVPGFGPIVSTALVAAIGNGISFRKGRNLAAWLGLVPRQHSTGGKTRLLGISKLGNEYPTTHDASRRPIRGDADGTKSFSSRRLADQPFGATSSQRYRRRFGQQDGSNRMVHPEQRHTYSAPAFVTA